MSEMGPIYICECGEANPFGPFYCAERGYIECLHCGKRLPFPFQGKPPAKPARYRVVMHLMSDDGDIEMVCAERWSQTAAEAIHKASIQLCDWKSLLLKSSRD